MLPVIKLKQNPVTIPWSDLDKEFEKAPKEHDLELGHSLSTWNWGENHRVDLDPWFIPIKNQIEETVQSLLSVTESYEEWVMNCWMNRHWRSGRTKEHKHEGCDIVFSCYLDVPENSGNFLLKWESKWWEIPVTTGDILVFPGSIEHATQESQSDVPRTVLTVNASPTGIGWREIENPDQLVSNGMSWPQALSFIRDKYIANHHLFEKRQKHLIEQLLKDCNVEYQEEQNY